MPIARFILSAAFCIGLLFSAGLTGCKPAPESESPDVLRVQVPPWMMKKCPFREAAQRFEADHPGKRVIFIKAPGDINTMIFDWERGMTRVDLVVTDTFSIMQFIKGRWIIPLDDLFDAAMPKEDFLRAFLGDFEYEGQAWGLPFFGEVAVMGYRKDLLAKEGLVDAAGNVRLPASYDELASYARKLTRRQNRRVTRYGLALPWDSLRAYLILTAMTCSRGGTKLDQAGNVNLLCEPCRETLRWVCGLVKEGVLDPSGVFSAGSVADALSRGTVAICIAFASWALQNEEFMGDKLAVAPIPGSLQHGASVTSGGFSIIKYGRVDLARAFIREQVQQEYFQNFSATKYKKCPARRSFYRKLDKAYWPMILQVAEASGPYPRYVDTVKMGLKVSQYAQEAWLGHLPPDQALEQAYAEISNPDKYKR